VRGIFEPIPPGERRSLLESYAAFLGERDGEPDFANKTLSRREPGVRGMETTTIRYEGAFDAKLFDDQYDIFHASRSTPDEVLALLVLVKTNASEAYAVEQVEAKKRRRDDLESGLEKLALLEETYHTRLLVSACPMFGVSVTRRSLPPATVRRIVAGIAKLPEPLSRPITLAGEIVGIVTFMRLIGAVRRVFASHPVVRDALEERITEILIDEIGHMSLNRLLARAGTFAMLHGTLAAATAGTRGALPEAELLGVLPLSVREVARFDVAQIPEEVRRKAFVA
jgi:hypothetical protein